MRLPGGWLLRLRGAGARQRAHRDRALGGRGAFPAWVRRAGAVRPYRADGDRAVGRRARARVVGAARPVRPKGDRPVGHAAVAVPHPGRPPARRAGDGGPTRIDGRGGTRRGRDGRGGTGRGVTGRTPRARTAHGGRGSGGVGRGSGVGRRGRGGRPWVGSAAPGDTVVVLAAEAGLPGGVGLPRRRRFGPAAVRAALVGRFHLVEVDRPGLVHRGRTRFRRLRDGGHGRRRGGHPVPARCGPARAGNPRRAVPVPDVSGDRRIGVIPLAGAFVTGCRGWGAHHLVPYLFEASGRPGVFRVVGPHHKGPHLSDLHVPPGPSCCLDHFQGSGKFFWEVASWRAPRALSPCADRSGDRPLRASEGRAPSCRTSWNENWT